MSRLAELLKQATSRLSGIQEEQAAARPAPGRWSKKEILGHLIDSASNNHQRFVRAQLCQSLEFPGYEQDEWVRAQAYRSESWADLVALWLAMNRHLLHVIESIPPASLDRTCTIGTRAPVRLAALIEDYSNHLEHHLNQL